MSPERIYLSTIFDVMPGAGANELAYSSYAIPVAQANGLGLELAEYCISDNMDDDSSVRAHFEANCAAVSRKVFHAPYSELYPHAIDRRVAAVAAERYHSAYRICEAAGCSKMIVHANFIESLYHPEWFTGRQIEFWSNFLEMHPGNITICIENVMERSPELITGILKGVDHPRLRMCLDVGHANLSSVPPLEWLEDCAPYISHLHLHNNNGRLPGALASCGDNHGALGAGTIPMETILRRAEMLLPDVTYTLETAAFEESLEQLRKWKLLPEK